MSVTRPFLCIWLRGLRLDVNPYSVTPEGRNRPSVTPGYGGYGNPLEGGLRLRLPVTGVTDRNRGRLRGQMPME
jgi:hypothetical protein